MQPKSICKISKSLLNSASVIGRQSDKPDDMQRLGAMTVKISVPNPTKPYRQTTSMNQSYFVKNLPTPLQTLWRPMLLISLGLHGFLLAIPMPSPQKPQPPKKEPEKVKITQLPTTPSPPRPAIKPSPKPTLKVSQTIPPKPKPIRPPSTEIPPLPPKTKAIPRPQLSPTPEKTPQPKATPTPSPSPTPEQSPQSTATPTPSPSPTPEQSPTPALQNPFADFPFPDNAQLGSLGLLSGETDKSARNTTDALAQVADFYTKELPARKFNSQPFNEATDLKVYKVAKEGAETQFLHLISKDGKTVIVLASQEIKDLSTLKSAETRSPEEIAFESALAPVKSSEDFGAVFPEDISKLPLAAQSAFADPNKFRGLVTTTTFKPKSPEQLFSEVQNQLIQANFTQISPEASYGGGLTYKVTQGNFTTYLYFVANAENKTIFFVSKDSPF